MKSRAYWIGLGTLTLAVLATYLLTSLPEGRYLLRQEQELIPKNTPMTAASCQPLALREKLEAMGISFPLGSHVYRGTGHAYQLIGGYSAYLPALHLKTTWANHQKFIALDHEKTGAYISPLYRCCDFTLQVMDLTFGLQEYADSAMLNHTYRPMTTLYFGTPAVQGYYPGAPESLTWYPDLRNRTLTCHYRAWPFLLILALAAYTIIFFLRRPVWRATGGLFQRRRAA